MKTKNLITIFLALGFQTLVLAQESPSSIPEAALLLSKYIQYPSVTGNEKDAGEFLASVCREKGLFVEIFSDEQNSFNFAASLFPLESGKPNIIFLNHIDVVPPGDTTHWTYPPFSGTIGGGIVWGRGAIDLKGLAIMQLMALTDLRESVDENNCPFNVTLLCVSEEENSSTLGAQRVVREHLDKLNAVVVFGEGGAGISGLVEGHPDQRVFCISTAEKQALWLKLIVKIPTSAHGSVPPLEYANQEMVQALARLSRKRQKINISDANSGLFRSLGKIERGSRGFALRNITWLKPLLAARLRNDPKVLATVSNTIALTKIQNPDGATNQIAQEVTASLDCRLLPGTDKDDFIHQIRKAFRKTNVEIVVDLQTVNAPVSSVQNPFYQKFKASLLKVYPDARVIPYMFPARSDNNYFRNEGIPVYGIKPVHLSNELLTSVHNVDERLPIESLLSGIEVYKNFLDSLMTTGSPITSTKSDKKTKN